MSDLQSEQVVVTAPVGPTADELAHSLYPIVLATPGVAGLVPTMTTALSRLRLHRGRPMTRPKAEADGAPRASGEGIAVTVEDDSVTVVIDITVTSTTSVLATAVAVRSAAAEAIDAAHPGQFTISVNVLDREPATRHQPAGGSAGQQQS